MSVSIESRCNNSSGAISRNTGNPCPDSANCLDIEGIILSLAETPWQIPKILR